MQECDVLAIAPHPDDAEIFAGGTLLELISKGLRVAIIDLTHGECGSRGTANDRDLEAQAASEKMGLHQRLNLGLPDGAIQDTLEARHRLAALIRQSRAELLLGPDDSDYHPDHIHASRLTSAAFFLAGVSGVPVEGKAHRPRRFLRYLGNIPRDPHVIVDITPFWQEKVELVSLYRSQLRPSGESDSGGHFLQGTDILGRMNARGIHFGLLAGVQYGEPFVGDRPFRLESLHVK